MIADCAARWSAPLLTMACLISPIVAQPPTASASKDETRAEFDQRFGQYKEALRDIEQLNAQYQTADASTGAAIQAQLRDAASTAKQRLDALIDAALKVYQLAPNEDPQITNLLLAVARFYAVGEAMDKDSAVINGGDNYELALPIIQELSAGGADKRELPVWGLWSAFATNDYDLADTYLETVKETQAVSDPRSIKDPAEREVVAKVFQFAGAIDQYRELWAQERAIRAAEAEADDLPRVRFNTSKGDIVVELFENEAPQTVANFLTLVKQGYYDGVQFHRVIHCFMAQGGDPTGSGSGGPGYAIRCECDQPNYRHHFRATLSMAHAGRDTGGSQFFITFVQTPHLDGKHTAFGRVIEGIEVLGDLQKRDPQGKPPLPTPDKIIKADVLRDRGHDYTFEKLPAR